MEFSHVFPGFPQFFDVKAWLLAGIDQDPLLIKNLLGHLNTLELKRLLVLFALGELN